jgi:predicted unusual protein kinase regulating ubiquinone biosynthesis (AarF/ABC1/UbiB family)
VIFVDFGMVAEIPQRLRAALRSFLVGLGTRDAAKVVQACSDGGLLLPGADLGQLEDALESLFDRFWGADVARFNRLLRSEAAALWQEFRQLLLETPIQIQVDLTFTGRAIELLSGLTTGLDPQFNPWLETIPFADRLAKETITSDWPSRAKEILQQGQVLASLPMDLARTASLARRGKLVVRTALAADSRRQMENLERSVNRLSAIIGAAALLVAGAALHDSMPLPATILLILGGIGTLWQSVKGWLR